MRPYVKDQIGKRDKIVNDPRLPTKYRKLVAKQKAESRRKKRRTDKKALKDWMEDGRTDEWGF